MRWHHRFLLASFVRREFAARYSGSVFGALWTLAHPLALLAVYAFVFAGIFKVALPAELGPASYLAFVAVGLWPWLMFADAIERSTAAIQSNSNLIRKVSFPLEILVIAVVLGCFAVHGMGYLIVLTALAVLGQPLLLQALPWALLFLLAFALLAVGVGAFLCVMQTFLPDTRQVVGILLTLLFFATPVLYPRLLVPEAARPLIDANPIGALLERLRGVLINGTGLEWSDVAMVAGAGLVCILGLWFLRRVSPYLEDFL